MLFHSFTHLNLKGKTIFPSGFLFSIQKKHLQKTLYSFMFLCLIALCLSCRGKTEREQTLSLRIDSLIQAAEDSIYSNPAYTKATTDKALRIVKDSLDYCKVLHLKNYYYFNSGLYDSAYMNVNRILRYLKKAPPSNEVTSMLLKEYNAMGVYFTLMGVLDSAFHYHKVAYKILETAPDKSELPNLCINLADCYMKFGDFANSAQFFRKALFYCDSLKTTKQRGFPIYFGLAQVYMELKAYDLSDYYFNKAEKTFNERPVDERFLFCNNRGNYYYYNKDYVKALELFKRAKRQLPGKGYEFAVNLADLNLSDVYLHLNNADSAKYYAEKCYGFFARIHHVSALYYLNTIRAGIALLENKPAVAGSIIKQEQLSDEDIEVDMKVLRYQFLQDYNYKTGNYKSAYTFFRKETELSDSIRSAEIRNRVAELDLRYRQDTALLKKNLLIETQSNQVEKLQKTKQIWFITSLAVILLAVVMYIFLKKQNKLLFKLHLEQTAKLRMQNIRNRISPHFVFNVIHHEMDQNEYSEKNKRLFELAKLLRNSLELSESTSISLEKELEFIKTYTELEKNKLGDEFAITYNIDEKVDVARTFIPSMIMQIPVENSIKHGLTGLTGEKTIGILIRSKEHGVSIQISDNGKGYHPGFKSHNGTGTGLKTIIQTIDLLNEKNAEKINFSISGQDIQGGRGTLVSMFIPDHYNYSI